MAVPGALSAPFAAGGVVLFIASVQIVVLIAHVPGLSRPRSPGDAARLDPPAWTPAADGTELLRYDGGIRSCQLAQALHYAAHGR